MTEVFQMIERIANTDVTVLIRGESGTGKELVANAIHFNSSRALKPFLKLNCAVLPDTLIESELFGHEKGAFTGATEQRMGRFERADGGTLFLDEIGELSLALQPKLLRFLENGEFRRIGGVVNLSSNVRVIGATNKNLMEEADNKNFRRDLLFRLNVITLTIPPLKNRGNDILMLAKYFLQKKSSVRSTKRLSIEAERMLMKYSFPGNVRELEHIIERSLIFSDGNEILSKDLNLPILNKDEAVQYYDDNLNISSLEQLEAIHIKKILDSNDWNRETTANVLGISQKTLYSKIKKYKLTK